MLYFMTCPVPAYFPLRVSRPVPCRAVCARRPRPSLSSNRTFLTELPSFHCNPANTTHRALRAVTIHNNVYLSHPQHISALPVLVLIVTPNTAVILVYFRNALSVKRLPSSKFTHVSPRHAHMKSIPTAFRHSQPVPTPADQSGNTLPRSRLY